jgi:AGZA family xanthine/uracil permease-like MFS transporter
MSITVAMGVIKLACAFAGDWVRRVVPRAALLGSIAGVAILLIAFLPSLRIFGDPLVGVVSLVVLLAALVGGVRMPWGLPGALAAVLAGSAIFWGRWALGIAAGAADPHPTVTLGALGLAIPRPTLDWLAALDSTLPYLPLAVPFALATVVGGIDNTESAVVAGDEYRTRDILLPKRSPPSLRAAAG